jgi:hypothetical protein
MDEFMHHLYDTLILLGGRPDIAEMLRHPDQIDESALNALRQYNIDLTTAVKDRLANVNTTEVQTTNRIGWQYSSHKSLSC